jgi:hypothetical protein
MDHGFEVPEPFSNRSETVFQLTTFHHALM